MTTLDSLEAILKGDSTVTDEERASVLKDVYSLMEIADDFRSYSRARTEQSEEEENGTADPDVWADLDDQAVSLLEAVFNVLGESES